MNYKLHTRKNKYLIVISTDYNQIKWVIVIRSSALWQTTCLNLAATHLSQSIISPSCYIETYKDNNTLGTETKSTDANNSVKEISQIEDIELDDTIRHDETIIIDEPVEHISD